MKNQIVLNLCIAGSALGLLTGCASTEVTDRQRIVHERLPKPNQILVYNFSATPGDAPPDSSFVSQGSAIAMSGTPEQIAQARQLGSQIAARLVASIRGMGLPATQVSTPTTPQLSGTATIEGRAKATAKEIAEVLKKRFQEEGWIN